MQLHLILKFVLLLAIANGTPVIAEKLLGRILSYPLDAGKTFIDGRPPLWGLQDDTWHNRRRDSYVGLCASAWRYMDNRFSSRGRGYGWRSHFKLHKAQDGPSS